MVIQQKTKSIIDMNSESVKEIEEIENITEQEKRITKNLMGALIKQFQEAVIDYQQAQTNVKNTKQNMTIRNAEIVLNRKLAENEKEEIINDPAVKIF